MSNRCPRNKTSRKRRCPTATRSRWLLGMTCPPRYIRIQRDRPAAGYEDSGGKLDHIRGRTPILPGYPPRRTKWSAYRTEQNRPQDSQNRTDSTSCRHRRNIRGRCTVSARAVRAFPQAAGREIFRSLRVGVADLSGRTSAGGKNIAGAASRRRWATLPTRVGRTRIRHVRIRSTGVRHASVSTGA